MAKRARMMPAVRVYRVGGSVRDELLGRPVADRDWVVVGATPEMLTASGYKPVGRDFPVFLHPETREEYALARTERKHGRGYHGFEFFVSPDVTLDQDLARRDLTINAMARDEDGALIDPYHGAKDLAAGVLRHVSPAFAEDPLRVLRVARFAARFGFAVAPATRALMRKLVASGEVELIAHERVWQELARGLMEPLPSRMLAVLRECGALLRLLPEVDALFVSSARKATARGDDAARLVRSLDHAAAKAYALPVRYAVLTCDLDRGKTSDGASRRGHRGHRGHDSRSVQIAERVSARLRVPIECRDVARLAARWQARVQRASDLRAAAILDLIGAADALRRPERLDHLLAVAECIATPARDDGAPYAPAAFLRGALAAVRRVDAGAVARRVADMRDTPDTRTADAGGRADAIAKAVRAARLAALRIWRARATADQTR